MNGCDLIKDEIHDMVFDFAEATFMNTINTQNI